MRYCARCATGGGGSLGWSGGVLGLVSVFNGLWSSTFQPNSQFWIPVRILLPQCTRVPSSAYHLWAEPCNSDRNSIVYPPHTYKRGSSLFYDMTWINFESTTRATLPSIPSTERTNGESVFVCSDSVYRDLPFWLFPTGIGALPLVNTFMNLRHRHRVWRQWWRQVDYSINLGPSRPPSRLFVLVTDLPYLLLRTGMVPMD